MKKLVLLLVGMGLSTLLQAQVTALQYLNRAPAIPSTICHVEGNKQDAFIAEVRNLSAAIKEDARKRSKASSDYMNSNEQQIKTNLARNSGMTDEEIKKLQSGKEMTEAEKMEMANRMMQQKANISMDEAKNLKNMSKEGKEAWAQGYAAEQKALAQANPQQNLAENEKNRSTYQMLSEQSELRSKTVNNENAIRLQYQAIENEAEAAKLLLEKELKPLYTELNSINDGEGSTQADVDHANRLIKQIQAKQDAYCEKFTPKMLDFLVRCKKSYAEAIPDYDRAEELQFQITAAQTGIPVMTVGRGAYSIQAVDQYLGYMADAYKYKLYRND